MKTMLDSTRARLPELRAMLRWIVNSWKQPPDVESGWQQDRPWWG